MPQQIDELKLQAMKREYCDKDRAESDTALAKRLGVSRATLLRYAKAGNWKIAKAVHGAIDAMTSKPEQLAVVLDGDEIDTKALLLEMIQELRAVMADTPAKSKEGVIARLVELLQYKDQRYPVGMAAAYEWMLQQPDYSRSALIQMMKERVAV